MSTKRRAGKQRGAALVELSIILPILLLVVYVGLSLAVALRAQENMNSVLREATRTALTECATETTLTCRDGSNSMERCLTTVYQRFLPIGQNALGNFDLTLSLYRLEPSVNQLIFVGKSAPGRTKFEIGADGRGNIPESFVNVAREKDIILIGEIFHRLPLAALTHLGFLQNELYFPYIL